MTRTVDLCLLDFRVMTMEDGGKPYGLIPGGAVAIDRGRIVWVGEACEAGAAVTARQTVRGEGRCLSPGLIDCHTHLVWGGSRADEWQLRQRGASYEEIARQGGGILSTVAATRSASSESLYAAARRRMEARMREGVTAVEIKSGYGLDLETELRILDVAATLGGSMPVDVFPTLLAAHSVPPEFAGRPDDYIDLVCGEIIPGAAGRCLAVDAFCETVAFDWPQTRRVFETALHHGLQLHIHAEQLSNQGAARRAAEMGALSADHLEFLDEEGVAAMAASGTVAVLLPGAFYFLRQAQRPPVDLLRRQGVPMAVATDANPGSSPVDSLLLMINMACVLFGLSPEEAFAGVTRCAAAALGQQERMGTIAAGRQADLVVWDIDSPAELAYRIGDNPCRTVYKNGEVVLDVAD